MITEMEAARWRDFLEEEMRRKDKDAWDRVLKTQAGRWVIMRILDMTNYRSRTFTGDRWGDFNEGKREVGLRIVDEIEDLFGDESVDIRHKAEKEYVAYQKKRRELYNKGGGDDES